MVLLQRCCRTRRNCSFLGHNTISKLIKDKEGGEEQSFQCGAKLLSCCSADSSDCCFLFQPEPLGDLPTNYLPSYLHSRWGELNWVELKQRTERWNRGCVLFVCKYTRGRRTLLFGIYDKSLLTHLLVVINHPDVYLIIIRFDISICGRRWPITNQQEKPRDSDETVNTRVRTTGELKGSLHLPHSKGETVFCPFTNVGSANKTLFCHLFVIAWARIYARCHNGPSTTKRFITVLC